MRSRGASATRARLWRHGRAGGVILASRRGERHEQAHAEAPRRHNAKRPSNPRTTIRLPPERQPQTRPDACRSVRARLRPFRHRQCAQFARKSYRRLGLRRVYARRAAPTVKWGTGGASFRRCAKRSQHLRTQRQHRGSISRALRRLDLHAVVVRTRELDRVFERARPRCAMLSAMPGTKRRRSPETPAPTRSASKR